MLLAKSRLVNRIGFGGEVQGIGIIILVSGVRIPPPLPFFSNKFKELRHPETGCPCCSRQQIWVHTLAIPQLDEMQVISGVVHKIGAGWSDHASFLVEACQFSALNQASHTFISDGSKSSSSASTSLFAAALDIPICLATCRLLNFGPKNSRNSAKASTFSHIRSASSFVR